MSPLSFSSVLAHAPIFGVVAVALVWVVARSLGRRIPAAAIPALFITAVFLFLTHHPTQSWLLCGVPQPPMLVPFRFAEAFGQIWRDPPSFPVPAHRMSEVVIAANAAIGVLIGVSLALCVTRADRALLLGLELTLFVEFSQLTGIFGLMPCPYRQFDVDDIILNALGIAVGFALARLLGIAPPAVSRKE